VKWKCKLRALDLFAGCGGLSFGLAQAGFEVIGSVEKDKWAAETYAFNHPNVPVYQNNISTLSNEFLADNFRDKVDVIVGGPPCQGFSVSGKRQYGELNELNNMVLEFVRAIEIVKPEYFLFENVAGFRSAALDENRGALPYLKSKLESEGYFTATNVIQAADFGIPQFRRRLFMIGSTKPLLQSPFPIPTHSNEVGSSKKRYVSIMDAIGDLPPIKAREGHNGKQNYTLNPNNEYQKKLRLQSNGVYNHEAMKHSKRLVERFEGIPQGGRGYDIGRSKVRKKDSAVTVYKSNNQRLVENLPSLCITANFQSNYVHPILNRNLTAREAARLQSFPDRFVFMGRRTLMSRKLLEAEGRHDENNLSQYNQIGNAVPPLLAKQLGMGLLEASTFKSNVA